MYRKLAFLFFALMLPLLLCGCSLDDTTVIYNIHDASVVIATPDENIGSYDIENPNIEISSDMSCITTIKISIIENSMLKTYDAVKNDMIRIFPQYASEISALRIESSDVYMGTAAFGTTYYTIKVGGIEASIPVRIESKTGNILYGSEDSQSIDMILNIKSEDTEYAFQIFDSSIASLAIEVDFTDFSPRVIYSMYCEIPNATYFEKQLNAAGFTVDDITQNRAVFYETYTTSEDFESVFPIRLFSIFNVISNLSHCERNLGISDKLEAEFTFSKPAMPFSFKITSSKVPKCSLNGEVISAGLTNSFSIEDDTVISVEYHTVNWNDVATCSLAALAIAFVIGAVLVLAIRSSKPPVK